MPFATLPAKNAKEEANIVNITNRKLDETLEKGTVFNIPAESFEYKTYDNLDEFVTECGSAERAVYVLNEFKRDAATTSGKNVIRTATKGTHDEIVASGLEATKNHSFAKSETLSAADAKAGLNELKGKIGNLTEAEIAAAVRKMLGM